jgi:CheY-like chemotaxis protein
VVCDIVAQLCLVIPLYRVAFYNIWSLNCTSLGYWFQCRSSGVVKDESRIDMISSYGVLNEEKERYWKRILIVDDDIDITTTFKIGIESAIKRIGVNTYNDPRRALSDFQPNFYDLLLIDINMPYIDGFQLSEGILEIDINVKICFMSAGEINRDALREIHPSISLGCFIKKPVTVDYLIEKIMRELD